MSSLSTMTQALTPEIMFLYQARPKWRGSTELASTIMEHVQAIRSEIKSGEDSGGWAASGGWRAGQARPGFTRAPQESFKGGRGSGGGFMNRGGGGGSGGGGGEWETAGGGRRNNDNAFGKRQGFSKPPASDMSRFGSEQASVPLQSSRTQPTRRPMEVVNTMSNPKPKAPVTNEIAAPRAYVPYKSMFTSSEKTVENTVVNTIIQDKLNKLSVTNYEAIRDFLFEILDAGETDDFLADFMKLIFHKAADSIGLSYCPLYARLLHELRSKYSFIQKEINRIYGQFLMVFNEVSDASNDNMEAFQQRNKEKKYRIGYSQFITELLKYDGIIGDEDYVSTVKTITSQMNLLVANESKKVVVEEYADALSKMIKILHTAPEACGRLLPKLRETCDSDLKDLTVMDAAKPGLSNKARFAIMTIRENMG